MRPSRFVRTDNHVYYMEAIPVPRPTVSAEVGHHIFVVDRSGSMWGDIEKLKQSIEQAIAVDSYTTDTLTTLISFSSHGDVTLHWSKVAASKVMELSGPYIRKLRAIRATFLTGISQALELGLTKATPGQTTGMTLFTDGYANDPSAYREIRSLDAFTVKAAKVPGFFLNCIGYRSWCDWPRMNAMSNALSGKTVKANSFKDVLNAMKDTQALLTGGCSPDIVIPNPEAGIMMLAINHTTGQTNASMGDLDLRGVGSKEDVSVYAVLKAPTTYNIPKGVLVVPTDEAYIFGALALAYTAESELRTAKEILYGSGNKSIWGEHQAAMTPSSLAAMVADLQAWVKAGNNDGHEMGRNTRPKFDIFDLAAAFNRLPPRSVGLCTDEFYAAYRRRSIQKIFGKRETDGTVTPALAELVAKGSTDRVYVNHLDFNTADASVQVATTRDVNIKRLADGAVVTEIEYVQLDGLKEHRTFTLISSGERNVETLPVEIYNKRAWDVLREFLIPSKQLEPFTPGKKVRIELKRFRMDGSAAPTTDAILKAINCRNEATARVKFLAAAQSKAAASPYTTEQVAALKQLHLTPKLYFSPPTTNHYTDKDDAVSKGEIDSFTRYKIFFGTVKILNAGAFKSGNVFLKSNFVVTSGGVANKKPKLSGFQDGDTYVGKNPRGTPSAADKTMRFVFDEYLLNGDRLDNDGITEALATQQKVVTAANNLVQGLVMEVGCTGLLPADLEAVTTRYEPDDFATQFGLKLKKDEKEGMFFVASNGLVISVIPETSWYTVQANVA